MPPIGESKRGKHYGTTVVGSKSVSMYVKGVVYKLMYTQRERDRMKPIDVGVIDWRYLTKVVRLEFDDKTRKATVIRLEFSHELMLSRWANIVWMSHTLFLRRSTRKDVYRRLFPLAKEKQDKKVAFVMAAHARLGENSPARVLEPELFPLVWGFM